MCLLRPTVTPCPRACACAGPNQCCRGPANMPTFLQTAIRTASYNSLLHHFLISIPTPTCTLKIDLATIDPTVYVPLCAWLIISLSVTMFLRSNDPPPHSLHQDWLSPLLLHALHCIALPYSTRLSLKSDAHVPHCLLPSYHLGPGVFSSSHACEPARQPHHLLSYPFIAATMDGHTHVRTTYRHKKLSFSFGKKG